VKEQTISTLKMSILISVSLFLVTLSFKNFFYYVPFSNGFSLLSTLQAFTVVGWILLIAAPPLFFAIPQPWNQAKFILYFTSVSLWTVATFLIKIVTLVSYGKIWAEYLTTYPVMFYFEWIVPAFYVWLGIQMYKAVKSSAKSATTAPVAESAAE
jgi:hypothetical protein